MRLTGKTVLVCLLAASVLGCATGGTQTTMPQRGTLTVRIRVADFAGMNAGSNAIDEYGTNRAVSNLLIIDSAGSVEKTLEMNGRPVRFFTGEELTVSCVVWKGPQANNDYRFNAKKTVTISGDTVVDFVAAENTK